MLRHYDELGLLKPAAIDPETGYRTYAAEQSQLLHWILILKNLDFSLSDIKKLLRGPVDSHGFIHQLIRKRIDIASALNEQIQKKIAIDRLIAIIEKEGFEMHMTFDLRRIGEEDVHEVKKNMPNLEMFLESAAAIAAQRSDDDRFTVFRLDISHFKQVNDDYGFAAGDNVIVACYRMLESNVRTHVQEAAIARASGDEFIVFARAGKDTATLIAQGMIHDMKSFDFAAIGCPKPMGCYIGGLTGPFDKNTDIRKRIEDSIEVLERARRDGPNSFIIESCDL